MGKIVHLTESQVNEIMDKINEDTAPISVDATADVAAANGNASIGMKKTKQRMAQQGMGNKDATITCDSDAIMENNVYTKKQLKEAKLRYLKENSVSYTKKEFKKKVGGK